MAEGPKLLDRVRAAVRTRHYSKRTEESYVGWVKRFILFHGKKHPSIMGADEVNKFLTSLAVDGEVAAATQNQALSALLFLYRHVLNEPLPWIDGIVRAKRPMRVPVVLTQPEVRTLMEQMTGVPRLVALLLYGGGLRLLEGLRLRVKDINFARGELFIRDPKGKRDRITILPQAVIAPLRDHLEYVKSVHAAYIAAGFGSVVLPTALARKFPNA